MIASDGTGLHSFSIGIFNLQHDMLDESIANGCVPTIQFQYSRELISSGERRLFILDGHFSHANKQFIDFCESLVALFFLPPHSTLLQPLDVGLFGPLQHYYETGINEHFHNRGGDFGFAPQHFLPIYLEVRRKACSLANIESAFRITGTVLTLASSLPNLRVESKRKDRKLVCKARVLTIGEGIAMVEEMDRNGAAAGGALSRGNLKRPSVTQRMAQALLLFVLLQGGPECDLKLQ